MRRSQFRQTSKEIPTKNGRYEARAQHIGKYKVLWYNGVWLHPTTGDRIMVVEWR